EWVHVQLHQQKGMISLSPPTICNSAREANDRGYECIIPEDCVGSYFPEFQKYALEMIKAQGAIFGWVTDSKAIIAGLEG
ncbi:isochorismatase family protein, partial [Escherichia coli]|nr:isochorismatase family protein [Escherichia coli]